jgi:hypothetical protein
VQLRERQKIIGPEPMECFMFQWNYVRQREEKLRRDRPHGIQRLCKEEFRRDRPLGVRRLRQEEFRRD